MNEMTLICIVSAFVIGVIVGWITMIVPAGGKSNLTREETRRLNKLINRAMDTKRGFTITLFSEGDLIDQVTVQEEIWKH